MDSKPIHHPSSQKKWNANICITFNFWWSAGLVDGLEPHPLPFSSQKMKCSFLYYIQLLMIGWAGHWTWTPSTFCLKPKKWNAHFWITFNFWWSAGLVDELESHLPPLSNQKNEVLIFGSCSTSDDWPGWSMDSNPIRHLSPAKEWNAHFWITLNFWWSVGLVDGLKPHPPPLSCKRMKCLFSDYVQLLMIGHFGRWTWTQSATPLQPKKWNACFCIMFNFWWSAGLVDGLKPHPLPFSSQKMKCSFLYYIQLLMIGQAGQWTRTPSTSCLKQKKMKCSFLDYV